MKPGGRGRARYVAGTEGRRLQGRGLGHREGRARTAGDLAPARCGRWCSGWWRRRRRAQRDRDLSREDAAVTGDARHVRLRNVEGVTADQVVLDRLALRVRRGAGVDQHLGHVALPRRAAGGPPSPPPWSGPRGPTSSADGCVGRAVDGCSVEPGLAPRTTAGLVEPLPYQSGSTTREGVHGSRLRGRPATPEAVSSSFSDHEHGADALPEPAREGQDVVAPSKRSTSHAAHRVRSSDGPRRGRAPARGRCPSAVLIAQRDTRPAAVEGDALAGADPEVESPRGGRSRPRTAPPRRRGPADRCGCPPRPSRSRPASRPCPRRPAGRTTRRRTTARWLVALRPWVGHRRRGFPARPPRARPAPARSRRWPRRGPWPDRAAAGGVRSTRTVRVAVAVSGAMPIAVAVRITLPSGSAVRSRVAS